MSRGTDEPKAERRRWLDERSNVDKVFYALCAICLMILVADLFYDKHGHYSFEEIVGLHAGFGFLAYLGLVLLSKQLRRILKRDEDYYD